MQDRPVHSPSRPPGALTAVMRAEARPSAPRALRVGLVHRGKVVDERVLAQGDHLTIGPNERATFVVPVPGLPPDFRLFDSSGGGFRLHVTPRMSGRVAADGEPADLAALRGSAAPSSGGAACAVALGPHARGKVVLGEWIVLFQVVPVAPPLGKPQLPASVKRGFGEIDWRTSMVAAFSFLFHFGAVGTVYSDWMDPVVDDEVQAAQLLESVRSLPAPPPVERPSDAPDQAASAAAAASAASRPRAPSTGRVATAGGAGNSAPRGGVGDARAHQIASQLAGMELQVLTGLNAGEGSATAAVLGPGSDLPLGMLDAAAASAAGIRSGVTAGLDLGGSPGGPLRPGSLRSPLSFPDPAPMSPVPSGSSVPVRLPTGNVSASSQATGGTVPGAEGVVAAMRAGFRRCYNLGLRNEDPTMKGSVRIVLRIGSNGEVLSASASSSGTLSATVVGCMRARAASASFSAPEGGGATLVIPVSVIPQ